MSSTDPKTAGNDRKPSPDGKPGPRSQRISPPAIGRGFDAGTANLLSATQDGEGEIRILGLSLAEHEKEIKNRIGYVGEEQLFPDGSTAERMGRFVAKFFEHWNGSRFASLLEEFGYADVQEASGRGDDEIENAVLLARGPVVQQEQEAGLDQMYTYRAFQARAQATKRNLLKFLIDVKDAGKSVVGYGAPAKGNTLLNYCGIRTDLVDYTVDRSPRKQNTLLPGVRIPVHSPDRIFETRPDYVLILPWNLRDEVVAQMAGIREWGGRFVVPIPRVEVLD